MEDYAQHCHKMAQMAHIAYMGQQEAFKEYKKLGYKEHAFISDNGAQCHVVWNKKEFVICFRGTEPKEFSDIKADLNAIPDRAQIGGWVHNGFQEELNKVWDELQFLFKHAEGKKFFITGHSLGGAMATVAASRLSNVVDALYTYGSPRVGTRGFVKKFKNIPHYRHVNNNDIVPKVPFAFLGYVHHCPPRYINYYGNIRSCTYWQRVKDQWRGRWQALKKGMPFDGAYDHGMDYYVKYTKEDCK